MIVFQFLVGLGAMVGGAHLFVVEVIELASSIGVEPLVLSLVFAPLATELPEKANSFFWVREGKDSLALGNITGAMVFQSTIPVAFGLAFTSWDLDRFAMLSAALGLAGGIVAYWALRLQGRFSVPAIVAWGALYAVFPLYVVLRLRAVSPPARSRPRPAPCPASGSRVEMTSSSASSSVSLWTERYASPPIRTAVCGPASKTSSSILNVTRPPITK